MSKNYSFSDGIATFIILLIGAAEAAHLCGIFLHRPFSECAILFGIFAVGALIVLIAAVIWCRKAGHAVCTGNGLSRAEKVLLTVFILLAVVQVLYAVMGKGIYRRGDITVETVGSFLENNTLYQVNPMTGRAYEGGIPSRLKILCLPTMYASLCSLFHVSPRLLIWHVIPVVTLTGCYAAYICLGRSLFPGDRYRQLWFLVIVALVIWAGGYKFGMDGFLVLFAGWRGVTLRNTVLIPYAVSLCIRKKYLHAFLCAVAEVCIVWTLYGLGACLIVISGMALARFLCGRRKNREEDER